MKLQSSNLRLANVAFPLTPGLSPGEREKSARSGKNVGSEVTFGAGEASDLETGSRAVRAAQAFQPAGWEASEPSFAELWCGHRRQWCRPNPQARKLARR